MSGGGKSSSSQKSSSTQASESIGEQFRQSFIDPSQAPFLDWLRNQGQQVAASQVGQIGGAAMDLSRNLLGQGQQFLNSLSAGVSGGGSRDLGLSVPALNQDAVQGSIDAVGKDIAQQLQRQMFGAGGIQTGYSQTGGLGGGREGVERGLAQEGALTQFAQAAAGMRDADTARRQQLQTQLAMKQGELGLGYGQLAQQGALGGLNALGGLMNLGMAGYGAQFAPLMALSQIVGAPTTLDYATGYERSKSTGTTQSKGGSQQGFLDAMSGFFG